MKSFRALGLCCALSLAFAAHGAEPDAAAQPPAATSTPAPAVTPASVGPVPSAETSKDDAKKAAAVKPDAVKSEPAKAETSKAEPAKTEASKTDVAKPAASPAPAASTEAAKSAAAAPTPAPGVAQAVKVSTTPPGPTLTPGPVLTPDDPWAETMSAFATADNADARAGGVVFVGSSSIRLWADLEKRYNTYSAVNRGFGGSTLADCVKHMDRLVLPHKPRLVVIYAGDNDLAGGRTSDEVLLDFVELTSRIQERLPKTQIVFVSIKPSPARADMLPRIRATNSKIRSYVGTKKYLRYIDVFTPMLDAQGKPRRELFGPDSLHLNEEGYALWHSLISPVLPTEEQLALAKQTEPKDVPLVVKEAAFQSADASRATAAAAATAQAAATPTPGAKPDAPADTANLPKVPPSPPTVRANVKPADAAPKAPQAPPVEQPAVSAAAQESKDAPPAQSPASASAASTESEASATEIARLPGPPRTTRANTQPADAAPAVPPTLPGEGSVVPEQRREPSGGESGDKGATP